MKMIKSGILGLTVVLFGIYVTIAQVLFIREFLVVLGGNEISIGLIYFSWFLGITIGAVVGSKLWDKVKHLQFYSSLLLLVQGIVFPILIYFVRILRTIVNVPTAQFISFFNLIISIILIVIPFSIITGLVFPLLCRWIQKIFKNEGISLGSIYVLESLGAVIGGLGFNFFLVLYFNTYTIIFLMLLLISLNLFGLNLRTLCNVQSNRKYTLFILFITGIIIAASLLSLLNPMRNKIEKFTIEQRWKAYGEGFKLLKTTNTKYQHLSLAVQEGQYSLLSNGEIMVNFPNDYEDGQFVHFFMSMYPNPKDVLFIGEGNYSALKFFTQYDINRLDYVEIDPKVFEFIRDYLDSETASILKMQKIDKKKKIFINYIDGRLFVKRSKRKYDLIIVHLPDPSTASLNRYYTKEFFAESRKILKKDGVFITSVTSTTNYFGEELSRYVGSVYWSLKRVFPYILVTPEGINNFIASSSPDAVISDVDKLANRFESRNIKTEYFTPYHFIMLLPPNRVKSVKEYLDGLKDVNINSDIHPISYLFNLAIWNRFSGSKMAWFFNTLLNVKLWWFVILLGVFSILRILYVKILKREAISVMRFNSIFAIFTTGFVGMAFSIVMIYVFQSIYGYVYQKIGVIVAMFMIGLVAGGFVVLSKLDRDLNRLLRILICVESLICLFAVFLSLFFYQIMEGKGIPFLNRYISVDTMWIIEEIAFYFLIFVSGLLAGSEFPLAGKVLLSCNMKLGSSAGIVDSADHLGAMCGAFVTGIILVPVLGIIQACLILAMVKLCSLIMFLLYKTKS